MRKPMLTLSLLLSFMLSSPTYCFSQCACLYWPTGNEIDRYILVRRYARVLCRVSCLTRNFFPANKHRLHTLHHSPRIGWRRASSSAQAAPTESHPYCAREGFWPPQGASGGRAGGFPGSWPRRNLRSRRRTPRNTRAPGARLIGRASSTD